MITEKKVEMPSPPTEFKEIRPSLSGEKTFGRQRQLELGLIFVLLSVLSFYAFWKVNLGVAPVSSQPSVSSVSPAISPAAIITQEGKLTLTGTITLLSIPEESGTHKLMDMQGQTIAILVSRKLDLNFTVPGVVVEVSGKVVKTLAGGKPVLQVESLKYRRTAEEK